MTAEQLRTFQQLDNAAAIDSVMEEGWAWAALSDNGWSTGTAADIPDNTLSSVKSMAISGMLSLVSYVIYFKGKLMDSSWFVNGVMTNSYGAASPAVSVVPRSASMAALVVGGLMLSAVLVKMVVSR